MDKIPTAGSKSICLPTGSEAEYSETVSHPQRFRSFIDQLIERYPGLFPPEIDGGHWLHDNFPLWEPPSEIQTAFLYIC